MNAPYERETENTLNIVDGAMKQVYTGKPDEVEIRLTIGDFEIPIPMGVLRRLVNLGNRYNTPAKSVEALLK